MFIGRAGGAEGGRGCKRGGGGKGLTTIHI
jgi:hypothetical protein